MNSYCVHNSFKFHEISILATKARYMDRIIGEAIEIELHPNNMNREVGFCLSKAWKPLICSLKNLLNMTPDLQGYKVMMVNTRSPILALSYWVNARSVALHLSPTPDRYRAF
jgi:hypothetical protein